MDYYFSAGDAATALALRELDGGPGSGDGSYTVVPAKDVIVCPHLELLVGAATGTVFPSCVGRLVPVWPPAGTPPPTDENSPFLTGPSIQQIPDDLRDALADLSVTADVAERWSEELWGFDAETAGEIGQAVVALARKARTEGHHLYWWSEL